MKESELRKELGKQWDEFYDWIKGRVYLVRDGEPFYFPCDIAEFKKESKPLSTKQAKHVNDISTEFDTLMAEKYTKGAREHGGNLWEASPEFLLNSAIEEAIDQVVYLLTLRELM